MTILEMTNHGPPNKDSPIKAMLAIVSGEKWNFSEPSKWSDDLSDFVGLCLQGNPEHRPSALELLEVRFLPSLFFFFLFLITLSPNHSTPGSILLAHALPLSVLLSASSSATISTTLVSSDHLLFFALFLPFPSSWSPTKLASSFCCTNASRFTI